MAAPKSAVSKDNDVFAIFNNSLAGICSVSRMFCKTMERTESIVDIGGLAIENSAKSLDVRTRAALAKATADATS